MKDCLNGVISRAAQAVSSGETYHQNGLRYCSLCHTPRECEVLLFEQKRKVPVLCRCLEESRRQQEQAAAEQQRLWQAQRLRRQCFLEPALQQCRFETAEQTPLIVQARQYAWHFDKLSPKNIGLLFTGEVGSGKTFAAACLANALIDRGLGVRMFSMPRLLAEMQSLRERSALFTEISDCPLLVLDDFGSERCTDYALEQLFLVVDTRLGSGRPMVVTTNLTVDELKSPADLRYERIFDRLLSMCTPAIAQGGSRRKQISQQKRADAVALLREEETTCPAPD